MDQDLLVFNGIDATTGAYLQSPMSVSDASLLARGEALDAAHVAELKARRERESQGHYLERLALWHMTPINNWPIPL
jgi:hypothetical protein